MKKKLIILITFIFTLIFSTICFADSYKTTIERYNGPGIRAYVKGEGVNFRTKPSTDSLIITTLEDGEELAFIEQDGRWLYLIRSDGSVGWVHMDYLITKC